MGEVYRAKDSKLNREVAIKVLPEQFVRDPERIGRFRREAQVLASLDHPNIARIYAFEETGSARFLVMEYVPGDTLRERIKRGPTPVEESLDISKQIAAALEAAHEKTIVHRDLKPANVKVTPEGQVKVLDFGLAKAFAEEPPTDPSDSPTLSAMTQPGTILGTAAYMSPEQARGKTVDKRTDIWALGCVLYELLTGKRAFEGEDVPEILASVMKGETGLAGAAGSDADESAGATAAVSAKRQRSAFPLRRRDSTPDSGDAGSTRDGRVEGCEDRSSGPALAAGAAIRSDGLGCGCYRGRRHDLE